MNYLQDLLVKRQKADMLTTNTVCNAHFHSTKFQLKGKNKDLRQLAGLLSVNQLVPSNISTIKRACYC